MKRQMRGCSLCVLCVLILSSCVPFGTRTTQRNWQNAQKQDTVAGYQEFIDSHPRSSLANAAEKKMIEKAWQTAMSYNTVDSYERFIMNYPTALGWLYKARSLLAERYGLSLGSLDEIISLYNRKGLTKDQSEIISQLLVAGANCLDSHGNWADENHGRQIYNILKRSNARAVIESMRRVIVSTISRQHVLFLVVKLGIPTSKKPLVGLLQTHGDKEMAEDYSSSSLREFRDGGADWLMTNYHRINFQDSLARVEWGSF